MPPPIITTPARLHLHRVQTSSYGHRRVILTSQLATRSHVSTNVRLDKSRDAKTSLLLNSNQLRDAATSLLLASAIQNHVTPQRFCCAQQQFKPRDAATSLLLTTAVQNETPQRLDRASQPGPVRAITEPSNRLHHDYILQRHASQELLSSRQTLLREQESQQDQVYIIQNANQELSSSCQTLLKERMSQQTTTASFKDMQIKSF